MFQRRGVEYWKTLTYNDGHFKRDIYLRPDQWYAVKPIASEFYCPQPVVLYLEIPLIHSAWLLHFRYCGSTHCPEYNRLLHMIVST